MREKFNAALELFVDEFLDARGAQRELPVSGHDIDAKQLRGLHHVLAAGPQGGRRALPAVAAIEQQRTGALRAHFFDERREVGKAADSAERARVVLEIEMRESVRQPCMRADAVMSERRLADQVRGLAGHATDADIDAGFAKVRRQQLGVAVGEMHQRYIVAKTVQIIEAVDRGGGACAAGKWKAGCGCDRQGMQELPPGHCHHASPARDQAWFTACPARVTCG